MSRQFSSSSDWKTIALFTLIGTLGLSVLSIFQKSALGIDPFVPKGFVVPIVFGAVAGALLGITYTRNRRLLIKDLESQQELQDRGRLLRDLVGNIPGIVYQFKMDANGIMSFSYVSPTVRDLMGLEPEEIIRDPDALFGVVLPEDRASLDKSIMKSRTSLNSWLWEGRTRDKQGAITWFRAASTPRKLEDGSVLWNGALFDVSNLHEAQENLRTAYDEMEIRVAERTRELNLQKDALDQHAIVSVTDVKGDIIHANNKFCRVSGFSRDEIIGQNHRILKSGRHSPDFYADMWGAISKGRVWHGDIMNRKKDGGYYWVRATIVPFLNETGKPYQYVAIRTDITERVKAEEELEHSKAKAEQAQVQAETANRTKSDLMANISHELRTPLNAIIGFSGSMKEEIFGPLGNDKYREYLDDIHNSGRHLLELINDVLDISAIEAGAMELREDNIDINSLVDAAIRIVTPRAEEGRVTVASNVDEEIPHIFVDERRVTQIVLNLLTNAIKFTPENGDVTVSARINDDGSLDIIIQDTGIGMDDGEIAEAMSKFGQVDSALDRKHEGTGLGLPLTLGLTELHGGTILISSEKGVGTSVTICFPHDRVVKDT